MFLVPYSKVPYILITLHVSNKPLHKIDLELVRPLLFSASLLYELCIILHVVSWSCFSGMRKAHALIIPLKRHHFFSSDRKIIYKASSSLFLFPSNIFNWHLFLPPPFGADVGTKHTYLLVPCEPCTCTCTPGWPDW